MEPNGILLSEHDICICGTHTRTHVQKGREMKREIHREKKNIDRAFVFVVF